MDLIARVEASYGVHFVRIAPAGTRFECNVRPRLAIGVLITISVPGLTAVTAESLEAWRTVHCRTDELDRRFYRPMVLADLMTAANAELFASVARDANADEVAAFARDRGGALLADLRGAMDRPDELATVRGRVRRFAAVVGEGEPDLTDLHPIEQLMALEHAVVSWMRAATEPPADELAALARSIPRETASAGSSVAWMRWWWQLARRCTRTDLLMIVDAAIELAKIECRYASPKVTGAAAIEEAMRTAALAQTAARAEMWASPPHEVALADLLRDDNDAHYTAYQALTHCAHAIAAALRADMDPPEANRHAAELLARRALELLR